MNRMWEEMFLLYKHLDCHKCLCTYPNCTNILDVWFEIHHNSFRDTDIVKKDECQMLCISFMRLTGEIFTKEISHHNHMCNKVLQLHEVFTSDEYWKIFIHNLKFSKNKYLVWNFIKSFSILLYTCSESNFSCRIYELMNEIKDCIFYKETAHILDFISNLVNCSFNSLYSTEVDVCKSISPNSICSFSGLLQHLCIILSQHWNIFMNQFDEVIVSSSENESINIFLILWRKLVEELHEKDIFKMFLNEQHVVAFFSNACYLNVISLQIYVDIIMQFFTSSNRLGLTEGKGNKSLEEAVSAALNNDFLNKLPSNVQISGFCTLSKFSGGERLDSVTDKKISLIFVYALIGTKDKHLLREALGKVLHFIKNNYSFAPEMPFHKCFLDLFMDQDDILLGIMLAFLRIYVTLKESGNAKDANPPKCDTLQSDLNPHVFFIVFLQRIGFNHCELLSFLTTDETPFLIYLLQYLKLLLQEWNIFLEAHQTIIKSYSNVYQSDVVKESCKLSSNYTSSSKKSLVTYSSSSSSDEEQNSFIIATDKSSSSSKYLVIQTLVRLKLAIQKLTDLNEFPYNAAPLISLLIACEERSLML